MAQVASTAVEDGVSAAGANVATLSFGHVVPFVAGTQEIQIVDVSAGSTVIGAKTVSPNPPVIDNVALQSVPDPVTGLVTVGWTASDLDGDALTFDVFLKKNDGAGGLALQPVVLGLSETNGAIDTSRLSGGSAQFRVVASDGVQSAFADSPTFVLTDKPPRPRIATPTDPTTVYLGQLVNFAGTASDPQDRVIPDVGLAWSKQGAPLGSGPKLSLTNLPLGSNQITLTATNSRNLAATTTVNVVVKAVVDNPGPTLTAGPLEIGWHVQVGEMALQTADLDVGNSGAGSLQFTATSGAPWLMLSAPGGTAPVTLTLTANPTGVVGGVIKKTKVTLTAVGLPTQVIEIPVTLAVGNTFAIGAEPEPDADQCPNDPTKIIPGVCGCGVSDTDTDGDGIADCQDAGQDLAVTKISAPATVTLKGGAATLTKVVKVQLQNRGPQAETIASQSVLAQLVSLAATSLGSCPAPTPLLLSGKSQKKLPATLESKKKLDVLFSLTFACANDSAKNEPKGPGHSDYSLTAHVSRAALGGNPDTHPADDACPRSVAPPFALDPNPNGKIKDKGCGAKKADKTFGAPVLVDVVVKP